MPKPGEHISHYKIISAIGAGGMGEVYLAQDTKLDRKIALKVLPEDVVKDGDRLRRFEQEARAASALNHPNILTIYEIGEDAGRNYISTEYVDGKTLRDVMRTDGFTLHQAIEIAAQTTSALSAAHEAGIIHRDIKPENIMVRADGFVKVLDFGLAKLMESRTRNIDSEDETRAQVKTEPGVIMGTVQYMSPEQTRGKATDARSDIWSLGCVMYEMFGGRAPFSGETTADLIAEIVKGYPAPLVSVSADVPERLDEIVAKTIEKDPDERYQSAKDLLIDLRRLKKKLDLDVEIDRSHSPMSDRSSEKVLTKGIPAVASDTNAGQTTISGAEVVTSTIRQHKFGTAAVIAIAAIVLAGFGYGIYRFIEKPKADQTRTSAELKTQRLTGDGKTREAAISPDGKFLVYQRVENEQESLWIKQIQANSAVQVVRPGEISQIFALAFTPDGNFVYFNGEEKDGNVTTVFRVPTLGGSPAKVLSNATGVAFSSDGKQIAFLRYDLSSVESSIIIANVDGTNERKLATRSGKQFFGWRPSWSADGKSLAIVIGDDALLPNPHLSVAIISTADGASKEIGEKKWVKFDEVVWHPSGDSLLLIASDNASVPTQLWEMNFPTGEMRRITNTLVEYGWVSITADGKSLALIEAEVKSSVWVSPNIDANAAKPVMPAKGDTWGLAWTPDKRIVYVSDQSGTAELWSMDADGSNAKQLTSDGQFKNIPTISPDGRYVAYATAGQLIRADINGGNPRELTSGNGGDNPDFSIDGKWVLYNTFIDGKSAIMRVPVDGGEPQRLTDYWSIEPRYSPDGKFFACFVAVEETQNFNRLAIVSAEGGPPLKTFDISPSVNVSRGPIWTPDGKGITYLDARGEKTNLWVQPIDGGKPKQLTDFSQPVVARRAYSWDGKQIAIVRGEMTSNAMLLTGFR